MRDSLSGPVVSLSATTCRRVAGDRRTSAGHPYGLCNLSYVIRATRSESEFAGADSVDWRDRLRRRPRPVCTFILEASFPRNRESSADRLDSGSSPE